MGKASGWQFVVVMWLGRRRGR